MNVFTYRTLLAIALIFSTTILPAQLDIDISKPVEFSAKDPFKTGEFKLESEKYLYMTINRVKAKKNDQTNDDQLLQSFDKKTLKKKAKLKLGKYLPKDAEVVDIRRTQSNIVVFSKKNSLKESTIYAARFDWDLNLLMDSKEIGTFERFKTHYDLKIRRGTDEVALMTQKYVEEGEQIKVQYTIFDKDFKLANSGTIEFPLFKRESTGLFKKWYSTETSILDDIYFVSSGEFIALVVSHSDDKNKQGVWNLMFVNSKTNDVSNQIIELEDDRWIQYPRLFIDEDELMITGFYRGAEEKRKLLSRDKKKVATSRTEGTFLQRYNLDTRKLVAKTQAPFDKDFIYNINKQNPANKTLFSKTIRNPELEDISDKYRLKRVVYNSENSSARMYCEYIHNYYTTTTDQNGNRTTKYHSERGNLFYFELSLKDGKVNWGNSIRKYAKYTSGSSSVWYYVTMQVLPGDKEDAVLYITHKLFNERNKDDVKGEKIKMKKFEQNFVTASIDLKRGEYDLSMPKIASGKVRSEEKIQFGNTFWSPMEGALYTINTRYKMNIGFTVLACATMPICCTGLFLYWFMPDKRGHEIYSIGKVKNG